jgi:hypothetical protein
MAVIDLRGRQRERQAQMLMMMQQMRGRSTVSGGMTELERVEKEIAEQEAQRRQEQRLQTESEKRIEGTQSLIKQREEATRLRGWEAGQKNILDWEEEQRRKRELEEGTLPLRQAQTAAERERRGLIGAQKREAEARTGKVEAETLGEHEDNIRKANEDIIRRAEKQRTLAYQRATMGEVVDKTGADKLEDAERLLQGNPGYVLPRNPDGSWKAPPAPALGMLDEKGNPTTKFAEGLDKIQEPDSGFGKLLNDAAEARARGAPPWVMKEYESRFIKESAMTLQELQASGVKPFLDRGEYENASKFLAAFRNPPQAKLPSVQERQEFARQTRLTMELNNIEKKYWELKNSGRIPVGRLHQPMLDAWAITESDDPELQNLRKDVEMMKGEYTLYLSGRAATEAERADIQKRIPALFDSQQTFEMALPRFQEKIKTNISVDAGILHSFGMQIPENVPILPIEEVLKMGPIPNVITETGYIPAEMTKRHIKGIGVLGRGAKELGGEGEFRPKGEMSSETEEPPMTTESEAVLSPPTPTDPMMYKDPPKARGLLMKRQKLMEQLSEE